MFEMLGVIFGWLLALFGMGAVAVAGLMVLSMCLAIAATLVGALRQIRPPPERGRALTVITVLDIASVAATIGLLWWKVL